MKKKSIIAVALSLAIVSSLSACDSADVQLALPTYVDDKDITIGIWNGSRHDLNDADLYNLQQAGVNLLVGPNPSKYTEMDLIDRAADFDINVLVDKRDWSTTGYEVPEYIDRENFWGFLIWDEPYIGHDSYLQENKVKFDEKIGKEKMFFVNLLPSGAENLPFEDYLRMFVEGSDLPVVSYDNYSLMENAETGESYIRDTYLFDFDVASHVAKDVGKPFWYTLLTAGHLSYIDPSTTDLEWQMYLAMTYGAEGLVHYIYASHDPDYDYPIVDYATGALTEKYYRVQEANQTIRSWDHIFLSFDWLGTSNVAGSNGETGLLDMTIYDEEIDAFGEMKSAKSTEDVIIGHFEDANKNAGFMVTNVTNPIEGRDASVSIKLASKYKGAIVIKDGEETIVNVKEGKLDLEVLAGSGVFVIPLEEA